MINLQIDTSEAEKKLLKIGRALNKRGLLKAIGMRHLRWVDDNFKTSGKLAGGWAPLRPNTVAGRRKGSSAILQDTGKLKQSFVSEVRTNEVWVGSKLDVALWHHEGTKPYLIRPVVARALRFMTVHGQVFAKYVHHPGLPVRRLLPLPLEAKDMAVTLLREHVKFLEKGESPDGRR